MIIISRDVVKGDEFLSLSSQQVINLISWNDIAVASEEKVIPTLHIYLRQVLV